MTTTETLDLAPAAITLRAADRIERNGLAHTNYTQPIDGKDIADWPMDPLGAIAYECGLDPRVWEDDHLNHAGLAAACEAADLLVMFLGFDPAGAYDETLGGWADELTSTVVSSEMRAAARQAVTS
ncbi:MAG TPA: hypothetical protein VMZ00_09060 [Sporichthya sp.]|nr:hypothetical protein [Sporichthya sp.]